MFAVRLFSAVFRFEFRIWWKLWNRLPMIRRDLSWCAAVWLVVAHGIKETIQAMIARRKRRFANESSSRLKRLHEVRLRALAVSTADACKYHDYFLRLPLLQRSTWCSNYRFILIARHLVRLQYALQCARSADGQRCGKSFLRRSQKMKTNNYVSMASGNWNGAQQHMCRRWHNHFDCANAHQ